MNSIFGDRRTIFILLAPALLLYTLLKVTPVLWSLGLSFFEGNTLRGFEWVGLQNFATFFTDSAALQSMWVSIFFAMIDAPIRDYIALETITGEGGWMDQVVLMDGPYIKDGFVQVTDKPGSRKLSDIKLMKDDAAGVEAQAEEIKARYAKIFGV